MRRILSGLLMLYKLLHGVIMYYNLPNTFVFYAEYGTRGHNFTLVKNRRVSVCEVKILN